MTSGTPAAQETDQASEREPQDRLRSLVRWLLLILLVLLLLFCCGQLALFGIQSPSAGDTGSNLEADYSTWSFSVIPRVLPEIIEEIREDRGGGPDEVVIPGRVWPLLPIPATEEPTSTNTPSPEAPEQPDTATPEPIRPTATASLVPTNSPSPTVSPSPTTIWVWIPSSTPSDTPRPPTRTPTNIPSATVTLTSEPTDTPIPSETPSLTPTDIPIPTDTDTPTPSQTQTPSETPTLTASLTPTETPTFTDTPIPCAGNIPPGEPNIGPSNGEFAEFPCGGVFIIDLGSNPIDVSSPDPQPDIRYYERVSATDPTGIAFDWVTMQVGTGPSGACASGTWFTALNWGDGNRDNNGHLGSSYPENDNEYIPLSDLQGGAFQTGISIDLDAAPLGIPNQLYPCVRILSPINWPDNDGSEMDSLEILP